LSTVSKEAVVALTRRLAAALAPLGIRVNCVHPGATPSEGGAADKQVAAAVLHLLSPTATHPTGHTLPATGAFHPGA
jgi:NAD(P)-dependent dehydrogenase (short-subunit alcohol dehydrogenase family)